MNPKDEEIVRDTVKHYLQMALDFNSPFCKAALKHIGEDVITKLILEGWRPPE